MKTKNKEPVTVTATTSAVVPPLCLTKPHVPEFLRLPRPGTRCPFTGLTRSYMNLLCLPTEANGFQPPVHSFALRRKGAKFGVRLVSGASLVDFILAHAETGATGGCE
jgi:hypothetical protein